ncbi:MAG: ABC-F family ATP-binding cassette domain-containing protein [Lachnospiraceae bacterium]|nr:ABC-F family ATP-binding cassette domain-containing protein [Lachnospiraceae bacterium]
MNILSVDNIKKTFADTPLLDGVSFYLQENEKVGVIGINGTGKSTLLKIIAGYEEADEGSITKANNIVMRYLPQNPEFKENETIIESILRQNVSKVESEWDIESNAKTMLTKLGVNDFNAVTSTLSGGQRKKVALVSTLLSKADILILDEPTNHLDNEMSGWLEDYLKAYRGAIIMVTHDRYFLDSVTNRIVEIDKGKIYSYQANYSGFLKLKSEREDMLLASDRKRKSILRNELEWIMRGARARSTKQKARIERYEELKNMKSPTAMENVEMSSVSSRLGRTTVELHNVSKAYGDKVLFKDFSYIFLKNDRIGFIGDNGCGKTTLMKIIAKRIEPDSGELVVGQTVKIGYYSQEIENDESAGIAYMNPAIRVIDYIKETAEYVKTVDGKVTASQMLEKFLFTPEKQYSLIGKLSGGEKRRLNLLRVLMEAPNVLILDEPTNDLDITTLTILEDYLDKFNGIVIEVSHDRYFLDRTVKRIFAFEGNGVINQYEGGYSDYVLRKEMSEVEAGENASMGIKGSEKNKDSVSLKGNEKSKAIKNGEDSAKDSTKNGSNSSDRNANRKPRFSYKEQREYDTIESEVSELEDKISNLEKEIVNNATDFVKLGELTKEKEQAEALLEEKMDRWVYLEELAEKIAAAKN